MTDTLAFRIRALTRVPVSPTLSRVEGNITNDSDVENSDESVAFSVLVRHHKEPSQELVVAGTRARPTHTQVTVVTNSRPSRPLKNANREYYPKR